MRPSRRAATAALLVTLLPGCCWFTRVILRRPCEPPDPHSYARISTLPFMGGSLMFVDGDPSLSHLVSGAKIPIRLGALERSEVPETAITPDVRERIGAGTRLSEYADVEAKAKLGLLDIVSISTASVSLRVKLFDESGRPGDPFDVTIPAGSGADLDRDGKNDLEYVDAISRARPRSSGVMYLRFVASREALNTAMFAYVPEHDSTLSKAGGNVGFNADGRALLRVEPGVNRSFARRLAVEPGDIILDIAAGTYRRVRAGAITPQMRSAGELSIERVLRATAPIQALSDVLPVFWMRTRGPLPSAGVATRSATGPSIVDDASAYRQRVKTYADMLENLRWKANIPFPGPVREKLRGCRAGACVGITEISARVGVDADLSISWSRVKGAIGTMVLVDGFLGASATAHTQLSETSRHSLWSDFWGGTFAIGPLLIDVGVRPDIGYLANVTLEAGAKMGIDFCAVYSGTANLKISYSGAEGDHGQLADAFIHPAFQLATAVGTKAEVLPYVSLGPELGVEKVLFLRLPATAYAGPYFTTTWSPTPVPRVIAEAGVKAGLDISLVAGARVGIEVFGVDLYREWTPVDVPLYHWEKVWPRRYELMAPKNGPQPMVVTLPYPVPECAPPAFRGLSGACETPPVEPGEVRVTLLYVMGETDSARPLDVVWSWNRDRMEFLSKSASYQIAPDPDCRPGPTPGLRCAVVTEKFKIAPGDVAVQIWAASGYDLHAFGDVHIPEPPGYAEVRCLRRHLDSRCEQVH